MRNRRQRNRASIGIRKAWPNTQLDRRRTDLDAQKKHTLNTSSALTKRPGIHNHEASSRVCKFLPIHLSSVPTSSCIFEKRTNRKRQGKLRREKGARMIHAPREVLPCSEAVAQPRTHESLSDTMNATSNHQMARHLGPYRSSSFPVRRPYKIKHFFPLPLLPPWLLDKSAERVACSNTSRTPSLVLAEHSRYLAAPIFLLTSSPYRIGPNVSYKLGEDLTGTFVVLSRTQ